MQTISFLTVMVFQHSKIRSSINLMDSSHLQKSVRLTAVAITI